MEASNANRRRRLFNRVKRQADTTAHNKNEAGNGKETKDC